MTGDLFMEGNWTRDWTAEERPRYEIQVIDHMHGVPDTITMEELYQAFRARLLSEIVADVHGVQHYGVLIERPKDTP